MRGLTERQEEIYRYVLEYVNERGYPPSIRDITRDFGFRSPKAAADHLAALERKGFIRRAPELSRAIEITDRSARRDALDGVRRSQAAAGGGADSDDGAGRTGAARDVRTVAIPLLGRIAAGEPILAVENVEETIAFDTSFVPDERTFLLRVVGDSMIDAHIVEGDLILVKPQDTAEPGEIVVALIDGEATVKRFFPEEGQIRLQPENPRHRPILVDPSDGSFRLIGRMVGLVRRLP